MSPSRAEPRLSIKKLLLVLGLVATAYAAALAFFGEASPAAALTGLFSLTGLAAAALCLLNYLLRGLRWRGWMAHYQRPLGVLEGLRLYVAGYALTPTPGNVGEAVRGLWLVRQPLSTAQSLAILALSAWQICCVSCSWPCPRWAGCGGTALGVGCLAVLAFGAGARACWSSLRWACWQFL